MNEQPGHYLDAMIERLDETLSFLPWTDERHRHRVSQVVQQAQHVPRFLLPSTGLMQVQKIQDYRLNNPLHLPYPSLVIEIVTNEYGEKMILIANEFQRTFPPSGSSIGKNISSSTILVVTAVSDVGPHPSWALGPVMTCLPAGESDGDYPYVMMSLSTLTGTPVVASEMSTIQRATSHQAGSIIWEFLAALQCTNIETTILPASVALNKKRITNGKSPFSDYHILTIRPSRTERRERTGTHASPRQHLRRGHIRRLDETRTVWVNQCIVGSMAHGVVDKDYKMVSP